MNYDEKLRKAIDHMPSLRTITPKEELPEVLPNGFRQTLVCTDCKAGPVLYFTGVESGVFWVAISYPVSLSSNLDIFPDFIERKLGMGYRYYFSDKVQCSHAPDWLLAYSYAERMRLRRITENTVMHVHATARKMEATDLTSEAIAVLKSGVLP